MAVDLMHFPKMDDQTAIQEAASQGIQSMEHLIRVLSTNRTEHNNNNNNNVDCSEITDFTVSKFKTVISLLNNRTGHARFRRGPVNSPQQQNTQKISITETPVISQPSKPTVVNLDFTKPGIFGSSSKSSEMDFAKENFTVSLNSSYMSSAITGDGSVSKGSSIFLTNSSGKPPLARKRCLEHEHSQSFSGKVSGSGVKKCHCKRSKVTRTIRVPAISSKVADIPSDEYSWRKYGQKPIKGSPHKRGYYRCSAFKDCPARKHVERALDDPNMLIVTYGGEHRHNKSAMKENVTSSSGVNDFVFKSA
ncbi:unnamed protein product [Eruca vesicaria subsp. sativa]|uniref:WRKY domain-containing protein n=1 Tax=Eruca vesicaria subsp. sativa TaxID=29727 RepID=A0ABC8LUE1_ERUVS|nr:unnamed protein product [Eruca vesicaria subsp. sativa]